MSLPICLLCLVALLSLSLSLSFSIPLSLTNTPLTFQHYPLLLPPDKASIVSQMLFNMESLSLCPSYRATHGLNGVIFFPSLHYTVCFVCSDAFNKTSVSLTYAKCMHTTPLTSTSPHTHQKKMHLDINYCSSLLLVNIRKS